MAFRLELPEDVKTIIETLAADGFEAYAVGGCVRDALLHREPNDWDITTSAMPTDVKRLFRRTVDTGIEHGTVTVMIGSDGYEVTTYRIDGEYEDCRHPNGVTFTKSLSEDLLRRDFTINAMAYNDTNGLVDLYHGMDDLQNRIIRCVGDPTERFTEDALRVFRAVRFAAQLGFTIEPTTKDAMQALAPNLCKVSAERIRVELSKLLASNHPEELTVASECGLTAFWLPEFDRMLATKQENIHHIYTVGEHTIAALQALHETEEYQKASEKEKTILNYSVLLHDSAKPQVKSYGDDGVAHFYGHQKHSATLAVEILKRLKFDNETIDIAEKLVKNHDCRFQLNNEDVPSFVRKLMNRIGPENMCMLFAVQKADIEAQNPLYYGDGMSRLTRMKEAYEEVLQKAECVSLKTLAVKGADLIALGYYPSPEFGAILEELLNDVLENPSHNTREYLLAKLNRKAD